MLNELQLVLRLLRFKRMNAEYQTVLAALRDVPMLAAAE